MGGRPSEPPAGTRADTDEKAMNQPPKTTGRDAIALQLWTIRDAMASDADEALRRVKAAGFSAVEVAPLPPGLTPRRLAECLARHGLSVVSIHGDLPTPANIDLWTRDRPRVPMSEDHLAWLAARPAIRLPRRGARPDLGLQRRPAAIARDHGLRFGMHNHWWEFEPVEG